MPTHPFDSSRLFATAPRTPGWRGFLVAGLGLPLLALGAAACDQGPPKITVQTYELPFVEVNYGQAGGTTPTYCAPLDARGQYEVVITDFALCGSLKPTTQNSVAFHSSDETNLRIIFPSAPDVIKKIPSTSVLKIGPTHHCADNNGGAQAAAFFAHNSGGAYDVDLEADSGSVTINWFQPPASMSGSFDLVFAGEHVTGTIAANYCKNLVAGLGK
jgi:hypothetical protein